MSYINYWSDDIHFSHNINCLKIETFAHYMLCILYLYDILVILMENKNNKDDEKGIFSELKLAVPDNDQSDEAKRQKMFLQACRNGDLESVKKIFSEGADIDGYGSRASARCPIHIAALNRNLELMKFLLENGANPDTKDRFYVSTTITHRTALHLVCGSTFCSDYNLYDEDVAYTDDYINLTCEFIELLVEHGANINAIDGYNYTPLIYSSVIGNVIMTKKLLDLGADPFIKRINSSVICYVRNFIDPKILYLLIDYGADVSDVLLSNMDFYDEQKKIMEEYLREQNNCKNI